MEVSLVPMQVWPVPTGQGPVPMEINSVYPEDYIPQS